MVTWTGATSLFKGMFQTKEASFWKADNGLLYTIEKLIFKPERILAYLGL
jgi:hypothetical protein